MIVINEEKKMVDKRRRVSILIPLLFVALLWIIQFLQWGGNIDLGILGILPRTLEGMKGIIFSPFIHGSWSHLASNTIPLLVLGFMMIYFYHHIAYRILLMIWLIDGCGVWFIGRESYHIGASGIVYGMASFLVFSGVLRRNRQLLAVALVVVFIYGGMIWGMFPYVTDVSWEAHLVGFAAGVYFAYHYRNQGPPHDHVPEWMSEEITDQEEEVKASDAGENSINYIYIPKKDSHDDPLS